MVVKSKEHFEKTRNIKNNDKSKKYILQGQTYTYMNTYTNTSIITFIFV